MVEYLHEVNRCRALFATHYHELTALAGGCRDVANVTMDVREWQDEIVFLHKVVPGAADRSYGIQVAKLAGLPEAGDRRAARGAAAAGEGRPQGARRRRPARRPAPVRRRDLQGPSLGETEGEGQPEIASPLDEALAALDPDDLSPKAAIQALYHLKELAARKG